MTLPAEKRAPKPGVGKVWIYGDAGIGKSTLAHEMYPDALILDTEGSTVALEAYVQDVHDWTEFRAMGAELFADPEHFPAVIVDTVDVLARFCSEFAVNQLAGGEASKAGKYVHPSDWDYGKGWAAVADEFQLRIARLCQIVPNVVFISHATEQEIKTRTGTRTIVRPALGPAGLYRFLEGFVDQILFCELATDPRHGVQRMVRSQPSDDYVAKSRVPRGAEPVPDPAPMDGATLRRLLEALRAPVGEEVVA